LGQQTQVLRIRDTSQQKFRRLRHLAFKAAGKRGCLKKNARRELRALEAIRPGQVVELSKSGRGEGHRGDSEILSVRLFAFEGQSGAKFTFNRKFLSKCRHMPVVTITRAANRRPIRVGATDEGRPADRFQLLSDASSISGRL
jgi:hypothetical protein